MSFFCVCVFAPPLLSLPLPSCLLQARDDILNGSHPVSFDKACEFAGIQAQIQFGPHVEHKHKPGFLDLKEFLPKEYIKQRGSEKKIFQDHNDCGEMMEIEAKVKYVKLARSLLTYGVSFFLVKVRASMSDFTPVKRSSHSHKENLIKG
ncbi:Talin-2 [Liparis tanakae]|uniref:Talin-2 n=1 Tax=Liparis tanakae TaxID=230148 RepID=A0A4Z2E9G8_9TELE|nr:Talin-2 [Liparis tanakae]